MFFKLARKSLINRKGSVLIACVAMTISIFVLLGVEHIRFQAKQSFAKTISGVDLILGARTGSLNLLLYSVFRIGAPINNISWQTYENFAQHPKLEWVIPMSLGDSHRGYRVLGTNTDYFQYFSYGNQNQLVFAKGKAFDQVFDVVLGAEVAKQLNYKLGDRIVIAHGIGATSFSLHDEFPFEVVGILEATGTPVDQTLHVSLEGIEAIHFNWQKGSRLSDDQVQMVKDLPPEALQPKTITAFMVGLTSKISTFQLQREINEYRREPMLAILPGVVFSELWQMMSLLENTLRLVSILVLIAALLGLSAMLLSSIRERRHEIQLMRVIGARPSFIFVLIQLEALCMSCLSILMGTVLLWESLFFAQSSLVSRFGLFLDTNILHFNNVMILIAVVVVTILAASLPSISAYRSAQQRL